MTAPSPREAAKLALDALNNLPLDSSAPYSQHVMRDDVMSTLRAALALPETEPVKGVA